MDYLTFTTIHTMIIISLCGIVYLGKQCINYIVWLIKTMVKEEEGDSKE